MQLHIIFNYSAAGAIRHVFADRDVAVVRFSDNLSYGPINPPHAKQRRAWIEEELGFNNPDITGDEENFWPRVLDKSASRVAWVSRRSSAEYCGFLEYLRRLVDLPTQVIDTTDVRDENGECFRGTGSIPRDCMQALNLPDTATEIDANFRLDCLGMWERLRAEDGGLRVVDQNLLLQSAPLSFYDDRLLSLVGDDWRPMARVMGDALTSVTADDLFLSARLHALVDAGMLVMRETNKPLPDVRRP